MKIITIFQFLLLTVLFFCSSQSSSKIKSDTIVNDNIVVAMFLSDFHIGENEGAVSREKYQNDFQIGDNIYCHTKVVNLVSKLDSIINTQDGVRIKYLILLGDIIDIAVHESSDAFNLAHDFFNTPIGKYSRSFISYFDEIIYIQGNHDHHIWRMLQEKYYIQDRLQNGKSALELPQQVIGLLNLDDPTSTLSIPNSLMVPSSDRIDFISHIFGDKPVHYVYPNLYINTKDGNDICVTHGHFFEPNWNKTEALIPFFDKINADTNYFKNIEMKNSPFTEFSDYSMAQVNANLTQKLTDNQIYQDKVNITYKVGMYLDSNYHAFFPLELGIRSSDSVKLATHSTIVDKYLLESKTQMEDYNLHLRRLVYGHTHIPCMGVEYNFKDTDAINNSIEVYNTGGWVRIESSNVENKNTINTPNPLILRKNGAIEKLLSY